MSISNLFEPNNYDLFANSLIANNLTFTNATVITLNATTVNTTTENATTVNATNENVTTMNVDNINEKTLNHGIVLQGNINISNAGVITFPQTGTEGIKLPTVGGTQALLNYYDENTQVTTMSGIWAAPQAVTLKWCRIGSMVTVTIIGTLAAQSGGASQIVIAGVPAQYVPAQNVINPCVLISNNADVTGEINIITSASIVMTQCPIASFSGALCGFNCLSTTYNIF